MMHTTPRSTGGPSSATSSQETGQYTPRVYGSDQWGDTDDPLPEGQLARINVEVLRDGRRKYTFEFNNEGMATLAGQYMNGEPVSSTQGRDFDAIKGVRDLLVKWVFGGREPDNAGQDPHINDPAIAFPILPLQYTKQKMTLVYIGNGKGNETDFIPERDIDLVFYDKFVEASPWSIGAASGRSQLVEIGARRPKEHQDFRKNEFSLAERLQVRLDFFVALVRAMSGDEDIWQPVIKEYERDLLGIIQYAENGRPLAKLLPVDPDKPTAERLEDPNAFERVAGRKKVFIGDDGLPVLADPDRQQKVIVMRGLLEEVRIHCVLRAIDEKERQREKLLNEGVPVNDIPEELQLTDKEKLLKNDPSKKKLSRERLTAFKTTFQTQTPGGVERAALMIGERTLQEFKTIVQERQAELGLSEADLGKKWDTRKPHPKLGIPRHLSPSWIIGRSILNAAYPILVGTACAGLTYGILKFTDSLPVGGLVSGFLRGLRGGPEVFSSYFSVIVGLWFGLSSPGAGVKEYVDLQQQRLHRFVRDRCKEALRSNDIPQLMAVGRYLMDFGLRNNFTERASVEEERSRKEQFMNAQAQPTNGNDNKVFQETRAQLEDKLRSYSSPTEDSITQKEARRRMQNIEEIKLQIKLIDKILNAQHIDHDAKLQQINKDLAEHKDNCRKKYERERPIAEQQNPSLKLSDNMDEWLYMSQTDRQLRIGLLSELATTARMSRVQIMADRRFDNCSTYVLLHQSTQIEEVYNGRSGEVWSGTRWANLEEDDHLGNLFTRLHRAILLMEQTLANANRYGSDPKSLNAEFREKANDLNQAIEDITKVEERFSYLLHPTAYKVNWFYDKVGFFLRF